MAKYKIENELIEELATLHYVEAQLEEYKKEREKILKSMQPKELKGIDYSKEVVDGGMVIPIEKEINSLIHTNANIMALEQLLNTMNECIHKKSECIKEILTERERIVFQKTFIDGVSCDDLAYELQITSRTIQRDRAVIIAKMRRLKTKIDEINRKIIENVA